jgi:hypothetical protein
MRPACRNESTIVISCTCEQQSERKFEEINAKTIDPGVNVIIAFLVILTYFRRKHWRFYLKNNFMVKFFPKLEEF